MWSSEGWGEICIGVNGVVRLICGVMKECGEICRGVNGVVRYMYVK